MGPLWSHCAASNRNDLQKQTVALNIFECVECEHRLEAAPKSAFDVWEQTVNYTAFDWPFSTNKLAKQIKWRRISGGNCVSFSKRVFCFLLNLQLLAWQKSRPINAKKCYNITIHSSSAFTLSAKCVAYHWCSKTPTHSSDRPTKNKMTKKQTIHANVLCILYSISSCKKNAEHTHRYNAHNEPPNRQPKICDRPVFTVRSFVYYDQQKKKCLRCDAVGFTSPICVVICRMRKQICYTLLSIGCSILLALIRSINRREKDICASIRIILYTPSITHSWLK